MELFDAMKRMKGGGGEYLAVKAWEVDLMNSLHMSVEKYSRLSVDDRATRIVAQKLSGWIEMLQADKAHREAKSKVN